MLVIDEYAAGYFNTNKYPLQDIQFQDVSSGNIDSGTIKLYGIGE
jgi:hypothetical protein